MGAINMCQFQMKSVGHNGGSNYWGPRSKRGAEGWHMSIKIDRMSNIRYLKPVNLAQYEEYPGSSIPNYWMIKDAEGRTLREIESEIIKRNREKCDKTSVGSTGTHTTTPSARCDYSYDEDESNSMRTFDGKVFAYEETCEVCYKSIGKSYVGHERACQWCGSPAVLALIETKQIGLGYNMINDDDFETIMDNDDNDEDIGEVILDLS